MRISDLEIQMSNLKEFRANIWKYGFSTNNLYDVILESYQHVKHEKVETESDENLYKIYQKLIHIKGDN